MNETNWTKQKIENILHSSNNKKFPELLTEWFIEDHMNINENINSICKLCGKKGLKYEYFIKNKINDNNMLVGSECILLFFEVVDEITVISNNEYTHLSKNEMRKHLNKIFKNNVLKEIGDISLESDFDKNFYPNIFELIKDNKKLSPKQGMNFMRLINKKFKNDDVLKRIGSILEINLKRHDYQNQILVEKDNNISMYFGNGKYLKYILSNDQKKKWLD